MMKWTHALIAGGAIILLTNAVVLGGAAYNRSGETESQLQMSQRELQYFVWRSGKDNSGITLKLNWRFELAATNGSNFGRYSGGYGIPAWLDKAKMTELGFNEDKLTSTAEYGLRYKKPQSKDVLLVLEFDGRAYLHQLQRAKEYAEESRRLLDAAPSREEMKRNARNAEENYQYERDKGSRLFVIDAGLDAQKLRIAYPDHARYAIVHGAIRPAIERIDHEIRVGGNIAELHAESVNVPLTYRKMFDEPAAYEVAVAFGKRLEPWIVAASKGIAPMKQTEENK